MRNWDDPENAEQRKADEELARFVRQHQSQIVNALELHARRMRQAGEEARLGYQQGQDDPQVRAQQDASMMTNLGFKHSALVFEQEAATVAEISETLTRMIDEEP